MTLLESKEVISPNVMCTSDSVSHRIDSQSGRFSTSIISLADGAEFVPVPRHWHALKSKQPIVFPGLQSPIQIGSTIASPISSPVGLHATSAHRVKQWTLRTGDSVTCNVRLALPVMAYCLLGPELPTYRIILGCWHYVVRYRESRHSPPLVLATL